MFLTAAAFTFADPAGDAHGDGQYVLPTRPAITADTLDLREFKAEEIDHKLRFTVGFGAVGNPWHLPSGFSAGVTDIFVKASLGGVDKLDDLNLTAAGAGGWQYHLRISGGASSLERFTEGSNLLTPMTAPVVRMEGTNLVVDTVIPAGQYGYWVTSSVYTPLSTSGLLRPSTQPSSVGLQAPRANSPVPVDVLAAATDRSAYTSGTLAAIGQTKDWRPWWLTLLGGAGLLITLLATFRIWRER